MTRLAGNIYVPDLCETTMFLVVSRTPQFALISRTPQFALRFKPKLRARAKTCPKRKLQSLLLSICPAEKKKMVEFPLPEFWIYLGDSETFLAGYSCRKTTTKFRDVQA